MKWYETLRIALDAIRSHRLRSLLTILGIWIGIASVVLTVGLGEGAQSDVRKQIDALGSNLLIVTPGSSTSGGIRLGFGSATTLTMGDATALEDKDVAPDIATVAPAGTASATLVAGKTNWTTQIIGTTTGWSDVRSQKVATGRFFTASEYASGARVVVLGATVADELFSGRDAVGQTVTIDGTQYTVIGVMASSGSSGSTNEDDQALMPYSTLSARLSDGAAAVSTIYLKAASTASLSAAYQEAQAALLARHNVSASKADFTITSQESLVAAATSTARILTILLGSVAGISLLVGGIGVMNIMLVSVSERVREIGLRKALGATPSVIRRQFLLEAIVLSLIGGVLGIGVGWAGAIILPKIIGQTVTLSFLASAGALVVAIGVGLVAGVYPASRAARLAPIDALRSE